MGEEPEIGFGEAFDGKIADFNWGEFETKRVIMYWRSMRKRGGDLKYSDSFGVAVEDLGMMMISWEKNRRGVITCFRV